MKTGFAEYLTKRCAGAYYTVEATFIVTITIVLTVAVLYAGLYVHDRMVIESVSARWLMRWENQTTEEKMSKEEFTEGLRSELDGSVFMLSVYDIDVDEDLMSADVAVSYGLSLSFGFLNRIWGGENGRRIESSSVSTIWPAKLKWDADAVGISGR